MPTEATATVDPVPRLGQALIGLIRVGCLLHAYLRHGIHDHAAYRAVLLAAGHVFCRCHDLGKILPDQVLRALGDGLAEVALAAEAVVLADEKTMALRVAELLKVCCQYRDDALRRPGNEA